MGAGRKWEGRKNNPCSLLEGHPSHNRAWLCQSIRTRVDGPNLAVFRMAWRLHDCHLPLAISALSLYCLTLPSPSCPLWTCAQSRQLVRDFEAYHLLYTHCQVFSEPISALTYSTATSSTVFRKREPLTFKLQRPTVLVVIRLLMLMAMVQL